MFPLGSNVFPTQVLPLHIFEERYRTLMDHLLEEDSDRYALPGFGVVLIERGKETGGGDERAAVGTRVEIIEAEQTADGRWAVIGAGVERLDVVRWHEDDPYPIADVSVRNRADTGGRLDDVVDLLDRTLTIGASLVDAEPPDLSELSDDPLEKLDQMSAIAPLGVFDRQKILEATTTDHQIELLLGALADRLELLEAERDFRATD